MVNKDQIIGFVIFVVLIIKYNKKMHIVYYVKIKEVFYDNI